jgi:hypothetical protein
MSDEWWLNDPIRRARFWVDVRQHGCQFETVTKREAGTGRVVQSRHQFNVWARKTAEERRETLEISVPWDRVPKETKKEMIEEAIRTDSRPDHLEPEYPHSRVTFRQATRSVEPDDVIDAAMTREGILDEITFRIQGLMNVGYQYHQEQDYPRPYPAGNGEVRWDALTREDQRHILTEYTNWSGIDVKDEERMVLNVLDGLPEAKWLDGIPKQEQRLASPGEIAEQAQKLNTDYERLPTPGEIGEKDKTLNDAAHRAQFQKKDKDRGMGR